ncbi:venom dipeptidyl peptidase 4 isoform X2 [Toxorhynchites rutilus septentrionalis]|uniref:venom dipeptidyl peptidase 4 isoform X2 n=1 Tax=Toxorhynchites rutilus septentrionalis TaxID=329112 RepID=UPI00247A24DE|nr:venom dipeptidyl peptidase 4 isoform X2 [Toxorhynchites rutilus septentrionalis]XP_055621787.1 venom dipeptidyl peptidase 4 isoform X2 [Toxorhynchites rutilus septentrionalis]XP_055621788.1 venom dipeptidyl peptidase 4 isoform X2 [Toxorhynchites rutilus septentrionalis]XP_055621789.1 venom dipeptidyl peptidase 4 isoform X2 [Toxorhynchites rutilus septentrionalis]XP_055621790.1 venom dipeptidyl peptidase 4 isoform X2 [Toxorhynchites rutilus septentrionalis]XP_055621791.1 venom dipeptidyl pep
MAASTGNAIEIGQSEQELVGSKKRNLKKFLLTGGVIAIALAIVVTLIIVFTGASETTNGDNDRIVQKGDPITLEDFLTGKLVARDFGGSWSPSGKVISRDEMGAVLAYDPQTNETKTLLGLDHEELLQGFKFDLSADERYLLVARGYSKIFRHSFLAVYDIVDLQEKNKVIPINVGGVRKALNVVEWSPVGNSFIFVHLNNLYYKASPDAPEVQITSDGAPSVYNGIPDWVYEEEVLSTNIATWFSPDGQKIAFMKFNDVNTRLMKIPIYGPPGVPEFQYPHELALHYPKAGTPNPEVNLYQVDLTTPKVMVEINPPAALVTAERDHIITSVGWATNNRVISIWKNRVQNQAIITSCDEKNNCLEIQDIKANGGWLELFSAPIFNKDGSQFVIISSQEQAEAGGYHHITMISTTSKTSVAITSGKYVVQDILKWDLETNLIFYTANTEQESHVLHIYAVLGEPGAKPQCLSCAVGSSPKQSYFKAQMSKKGNYMVLEAKGPGVPQSEMLEWSFVNKSVLFKPVMVLETNAELRDRLQGKVLPEVQYHEIDLGNGFTSMVMLLVPPGADLSGKTKYPMLVDVYGGPNSYSVTSSWSVGWGHHMSSNRSVVYAKIDGRGSGLRGDKLLFQLYRKLGTVEIEDQITTSQKLAEKLNFIDPSRIAIWGWSYGGYASAMALAKDEQHVFKCAVSVAPVTDWTFYDSIYTERYMGLPTLTDNKRGYEQSRLTALFENFRNRKYMLIHGTYDDNVHFQQAMQLSRALETHDIMFKQVSYPDEDHSLAGVRPHLYHTLGRFFSDCFDQQD